MTFDKKITLFNRTTPNGTAQPQKKDESTVWASIDTIGSTVSFNALAVGIKLTNQVEMWAKEYNQEQYATVDGKDYRIESAVKTGNQLTIKLLLSRG